jgi:hypothetical protein
MITEVALAFTTGVVAERSPVARRRTGVVCGIGRARLGASVVDGPQALVFSFPPHVLPENL